jgi:malonyl-CoA O-methyltransferase
MRSGTDPEDRFALDARLVRRSFDAAGSTYDAAAVLQDTVRSRLHERLDVAKVEPRVVLDLGTGTGHGARSLKARYPSARVIAIDIAPGMLAAARRRRGWRRRFDLVLGDAGRLPLKDATVDVVVSNLMLQWCDPPDTVFEEVLRVLRPDGLFTFTTFGPDTLGELRAAWTTVDRYTHVNRFIDMHDLGDALLRTQFTEPVMDVERYTLTYPDTPALMRDLKAIGAHNVTRGRPPGLTGKGRFAAMRAAYEAYRCDGRLPATYEVVYGQAWVPRQRRQQSASREVAVPVTAIGTRRPASDRDE